MFSLSQHDISLLSTFTKDTGLYECFPIQFPTQSGPYLLSTALPAKGQTEIPRSKSCLFTYLRFHFHLNEVKAVW